MFLLRRKAHRLHHRRDGTWKTLSWLGISDTLAILRILQSVLTTSTFLLFNKALDTVAWILTKKDAGTRTLRLLGLSSTTGLWGVMGLLVSFQISTTPVPAHLVQAVVLRPANTLRASLVNL